MKIKNIFHIGFFHSASKLLQSEIFPNIPNYNFANYNKTLIKKFISYMPKNFGKSFYYEDPKIFKDTLPRLRFKEELNKISEIICDTNLCEKLEYQNNELLKNYLINTKTASKTISNFLNNLEQTCNT